MIVLFAYEYKGAKKQTNEQKKNLAKRVHPAPSLYKARGKLRNTLIEHMSVLHLGISK